jgi:hypothetical protein
MAEYRSSMPHVTEEELGKMIDEIDLDHSNYIDYS